LKRGTLILTLIAGALVFLCVLVLYLPASWIASKLPPQMRCAELGGSIWQGECLGLTFQGDKIGDATWNLSPLKALTGKLSGDIDVRGGALIARGNLHLAFDGAGEITHFDARFPLDPAFLRQFNRNQRGLVSAQFPRLVLGAGGAPKLLQGVVELRDFREVSPRVRDLGNYRLSFDGNPQANGVNVGTLTDLGGAFAVNGTVTFTPPNTYVVQGTIAGRTAEAEAIVRNEIALGAPPDASGRNEFSIESSF
jgi:Type II secretion system (T2SS), protein N